MYGQMKDVLAEAKWTRDKETGGHKVRLKDGRLLLISKEGQVSLDRSDPATDRIVSENRVAEAKKIKEIFELQRKILKAKNRSSTNEESSQS